MGAKLYLGAINQTKEMNLAAGTLFFANVSVMDREFLFFFCLDNKIEHSDLSSMHACHVGIANTDLLAQKKKRWATAGDLSPLF